MSAHGQKHRRFPLALLPAGHNPGPGRQREFCASMKGRCGNKQPSSNHQSRANGGGSTWPVGRWAGGKV